MAKPNPVVHFEMGYNDKERAKKFYETVFGWKMQEMGADMSGYVVAQTSATDEKGMVQNPGNINGGFYAKTASPTSHAPSVVIAVDDIKQAMQDVVSAGGTIAGAMGADGQSSMEPMMIPGVGLWISFIDPEGNRTSLLQPVQM